MTANPSDRTDATDVSESPAAETETTTVTDIAEDLLDYLRETPGVCANGNVHGWAWVRYHNGDWQATQYYSGSDRLNSYVEGAVITESRVLRWLEAKSVTIIPETEAYLWTPSEQTVWEDAAEQGVFTDHDRCFWCGHSDQTRDLELYETIEDAACLLCQDCHESWEQADQILGVADDDSEVSA